MKEEPTVTTNVEQPRAEPDASAAPALGDTDTTRVDDTIVGRAKRDIAGYVAPVLISSIVTLLALAPVLYVRLAHLPKPVATVDLQQLVVLGQQRYLDRRSMQAAASIPDVSTATAASAEFARDLSAAVIELGATCKCVLVNKAAVLNSDAIADYTDQLRDKLKLPAAKPGAAR
ncbi:hypothetical protein DF112_23385 [Burkholderia stagnalis]|uniref:hypothetical protein n=1 Tax=Burkholderia stagnalis TaxID=1503054 RepID=UPI000F5F8B35|nr:hypothetical protein [Burkholderia stagnalis]RQX95004.1 hypothetical protein DF119_22770 [Burkholderia stagnalis]RQY32557.1 hypothetical protein DF116_27025 [Burkholderia stagnalis]RQY49625.1 hypothetical protein DF112_23385 [Burkholderia stagnalis]RQY56573.1 hypothetical protein DF111_12190 [Burkholderia stagnalis]RQY86345.1 hypothetical protein DF108_12005 [Burkholderia stagnalis]